MTIKFSGFTSGNPIVGTDIPVGLQSGNNVQWTWNQIATFMWASPSLTGTITLGSGPVLLTSPAAATLQLGAADAPAPVAQTLSLQSVSAGTSNTAGQTFTINLSRGTGNAAGGNLIFQAAQPSSSGSTQNALTYAGSLSIGSTVVNLGVTGYVAAAQATLQGACNAALVSNGLALGSTQTINWTSSANNAFATIDTIITRATAATFQLGAADAAAPVAQTLQVQSVVGGTLNTAGVDFTINASRGTGTGAGGRLLFQTAAAGGSGSGQNALVTALTINSSGSIVTSAAIQAGGTIVSNGGSGGTLGQTTGGHGSVSNSAGTSIIDFLSAGVIQLGNDDAAAPVAQTLQVQSVVTGTTNTAGANFFINGSKSTGNASGGAIIFQTAPSGSSGSSQNALQSALTIAPSGNLTSAVASGISILHSFQNPNGGITLAYNNAQTATVSSAGSSVDLVLNATGTNSLRFGVAGTNYWFVNSSGMFFAQTDNSNDIGASGATRPRSIYVGTSITDPVLIGGSGVASTLELRATSGVGNTTEGVLVTGGNNGSIQIAQFFETFVNFPPNSFALLLPGTGSSLQLGAKGSANAPFIDFHSSGVTTNFDSRLQPVSGSGSATDGAGTLKCLGTFEIIPVASTAQQALLTVHSPSGAFTSGISNPIAVNDYGINYLSTTSDNVARNSGASNKFGTLLINHNFGGSATIGGRNAFTSYLIQTATTSASNNDRNYQAINTAFYSNQNDTGTNTGANAAGAGFCYGGAVILDSGATNWLNASFLEANIAIVGTATVKHKTLLQLASLPQDAVRGVTTDAMIALTSQPSATGWTNGILFSDFGGGAPMQSGGTLIATTGAHTITGGINLTSYSFTGNAIATPSFSVNGAGAITGLSAALTTSAAATFALLTYNVHDTAGDVLQGWGVGATGAGDTTSVYVAMQPGAGGVTYGSIARNGTAVVYNTTSDERLKNDLGTSSFGLNNLLQIKVRDFAWKSDEAQRLSHGMFAQELHEIYPFAVSKGGDDLAKNPWAVDYGRLTPLIIRSVQELAEQVRLLKSDNEDLRNRLSMKH